MERRVLALSLLALVVVTSGCIDGGSNSTTSEGSEAISIHEFSVSPDEIYQGSNVRVQLEFANTGNNNATLWTGDQGEEVFKNYCPDVFSIGSFQSNPGELIDQTSMNFPPGREAELQWVLNQSSEVPLIGYDCGLDVEIPFNYSVSSFRQVQIKEDSSVEGSQTLESKSSEGPLKLAIAAIGGTGDEGESTFIADQDNTAQIRFQLQNQREDDYAKGLIDVDESSMKISADPPLEFDLNSDQCNFDPEEDQIRMYEGQSRLITCNIDLQETDLDRPSQISEITASVDYTYLKEAGEHEIKVKYRGN